VRDRELLRIIDRELRNQKISIGIECCEFYVNLVKQVVRTNKRVGILKPGFNHINRVAILNLGDSLAEYVCTILVEILVVNEDCKRAKLPKLIKELCNN